MVKWKYPKDSIWNGENEKRRERERERVVVVVWNGLVMFSAEWLKCTSERKSELIQIYGTKKVDEDQK